jgi:hypothetical protein
MLHIQTAVVNNPLFIELQYETLKYFVQGEYTFTVFNDAKQFPDFSNFGDTSVHSQIQTTCSRLNIPCYTISNERHRYMGCAATRCADAMNAMLSFQLQHPAKYLCIDSDMFCIAPFCTTAYDAYAGAVVPQVRSNGLKELRYFWNGLYYFDMDRLRNKERMNWRCNDVEGVWTDVGGGMYGCMADNLDQLNLISHFSSGSWGVDNFPAQLDSRWLEFLTRDTRNQGSTFFAELYDNHFLHYRAGGNWEKRNPTEYMASVNSLKQVVYSICKN